MHLHLHEGTIYYAYTRIHHIYRYSPVAIARPGEAQGQVDCQDQRLLR